MSALAFHAYTDSTGPKAHPSQKGSGLRDGRPDARDYAKKASLEPCRGRVALWNSLLGSLGIGIDDELELLQSGGPQPVPEDAPVNRNIFTDDAVQKNDRHAPGHGAEETRRDPESQG